MFDKFKKIAENMKTTTIWGGILGISLVTLSGPINPLYAANYSAKIVYNNNNFTHQVGINPVVAAETKTIVNFEKDVRNKIYERLKQIYPKINKTILLSVANDVVNEEMASSTLKQNQVHFDKLNIKDEKFKIDKNNVTLGVADNKINKIVKFIIDKYQNKISNLINHYEKVFGEPKIKQQKNAKQILDNFIHIEAQLIKSNLHNKEDIKRAGVIFRKALPVFLKNLKTNHPNQDLLSLLQNFKNQQQLADLIIEKVKEYNLKQTSSVDKNMKNGSDFNQDFESYKNKLKKEFEKYKKPIPQEEFNELDMSN